MEVTALDLNRFCHCTAKSEYLFLLVRLVFRLRICHLSIKKEKKKKRDARNQGIS